MEKGTCSIDGCERKQLARSFCATHYRRWRLYGDPLTLRRCASPPMECSVAGCERTAEKRGWCGMHYRRWWLHGDAEREPRRRKSNQPPRPPREPVKLPELSELEAAWLAGLFEGEGSIILPKTTVVRLVIGMTDRDIIERVNTLVPMPRGILHRTKERDHWKDKWIWYANDGAVVETVLRAMLPWLGERRRARADEALELLASRKPHGWWHREKTHCPKGHPYDEANTYVNTAGGRSCKTCARARAQEFEQRSRAARAT